MEKDIERMIFEAGLRAGEPVPGVDGRLAAFMHRRRARLRLGLSAAAAVVILILGPLLFNSRSGTNSVTSGSGGGAVYIMDDSGNKVFLGSPDWNIEYAEVVDRNTVRYEAAGDIALTHTHTLTVPKGADDISLTLSDGTVIWVNMGSRVRYPAKFSADGQREVELLYGEAFFAVARDTLRPFIVKTQHSRTQVLGTRFNMQAFGHGRENITLEQGSVAVRKAGGEWSEGKVLAPGQNAAVTEQGIEVTQVDLKEYTAWKNGYYHYDQKTAGEILESICNHYDYSLEEGDYGDERVRFWFDRSEDMTDVIRRLGQIANVKIELKGNTIRVKKR